MRLSLKKSLDFMLFLVHLLVSDGVSLAFVSD